MKVEPFLAEINRMRNEMGKDESDIEWLSLHHAFCFISYQMADFQKYLNEAEARGEFEEYKKGQEER